jgi:hypothetical protein
MTEDVPEVVETISAESESLSETVDDLQEFQDVIAEHQQRVENMTATEQDSFYESVNHVRERVKTAAAPAELLRFEEDIEAAVRSPLKREAQESLSAFLELVGVDLEADVRRQTFEKLEAKIPAELERTADSYRSLTDELANHEPVHDALEAELEAQPSMLQAPTNDVEPAVLQLIARHETLQRLEDALTDGAGRWVPAMDLTGDDRFYTDAVDDVDVAAVENRIHDVELLLGSLDDHHVDVRDLVRGRLEDALETGQVDRVLSTVESIDDDLVSLADAVRDVGEFVANIEDASALPEPFKSDVKGVRSTFEELQNSELETFDAVEQGLEQAQCWKGELVDRLYDQLRAEIELCTELAGTDGADPPVVSDLTLSPLTRDEVEANPATALADYESLYKHLTSSLETASGTFDERKMIETWRSLTTGQTVELTAANRETVLTLAEHVSLKISLGDG